MKSLKPALLLLSLPIAPFAAVTVFLNNGSSLEVRILAVTDRLAVAVDDGRGDTTRIPFTEIAGIARDGALDKGPFDGIQLGRYAEPSRPGEAVPPNGPPARAEDPAAAPTSPPYAMPFLAHYPASAGSTSEPPSDAGSQAAAAEQVCRYAKRQSKGMVMDLCDKMSKDAELRLAWSEARQSSQQKTVLSLVTGGGGLLLVMIGMGNAAANTTDCLDDIVDFDDEECGGKPVGIFFGTGALLGLASIISMAWPNADQERAMELTRRR